MIRAHRAEALSDHITHLWRKTCSFRRHGIHFNIFVVFVVCNPVDLKAALKRLFNAPQLRILFLGYAASVPILCIDKQVKFTFRAISLCAAVSHPVDLFRFLSLAIRIIAKINVPQEPHASSSVRSI